MTINLLREPVSHTGRQGAKSYQDAMKRYEIKISQVPPNDTTQVDPQETVTGKKKVT